MSHPEGPDGPMPDCGPDGTTARMRLATAMLIAGVVVLVVAVVWVAVG